MRKTFRSLTKYNDNSTTSKFVFIQQLPSKKRIHDTCQRKLPLLKVGFAIIGIILISARTKNINVSYITNVNTRKTFVAPQKLNVLILLQSQSQENQAIKYTFGVNDFQS